MASAEKFKKENTIGRDSPTTANLRSLSLQYVSKTARRTGPRSDSGNPLDNSEQ